MDVDKYEDLLDLLDPRIQEMLRESAEDVKAGRTHPATELLAEVASQRQKSAKKNRLIRRGCK